MASCRKGEVRYVCVRVCNVFYNNEVVRGCAALFSIYLEGPREGVTASSVVPHRELRRVLSLFCCAAR